jgi:hypothetical protein
MPRTLSQKPPLAKWSKWRAPDLPQTLFLNASGVGIRIVELIYPPLQQSDNSVIEKDKAARARLYERLGLPKDKSVNPR